MVETDQVSFHDELFNEETNPEITEIFLMVSGMLPGYDLTFDDMFQIRKYYIKYGFKKFDQMLKENERNIEKVNDIVSAGNAKKFIDNFKGYLRNFERGPIDQEKARLFGTLRRKFGMNEDGTWHEIYLKALSRINEYIQVLIEHGYNNEEIEEKLHLPVYDVTRTASTFEIWEDTIAEMISSIENPSGQKTFGI